LFITFEGIEGCGKSTQVGRLADRLKASGIDPVLTLEPGGTRLGREIRGLLLDSRNTDLSPFAELLLYEADRAQHVKEVIAPALKKGKWVICDRFFDATTVYQGYARGQDMALLKKLNETASLGIRPDMTFLLDCPVEVGLERALRRESARNGTEEKGQDRFERERREFHEAVRKGYLALAGAERQRFVVVDAALSEGDLEALIFERVRPHIPGVGGL
jgi:dTMP kinase